MKSMLKILSRYVVSAAGVALILLFLNLLVFIIWTVQTGRVVGKEYHISHIADSLIKENGQYELSDTGEQAVKEQYEWAMLLDDDGRVIWDKDLPGEVPLIYTAAEVASFTRWYLQDYPVNVWQHPDGLLVLGSAKDSKWKMGIEIPEKVMDNLVTLIPGIVILNAIAAVLLALLFGIRLLHYLRPITKGIEDIAENQAVSLSTGGLLGDLAARLNQTSAQLQKQEAALQKRDNARTTWIAGVSHDIRTPLAIVMGYASRLEDNPGLTPAQQKQAHIIRRQSEKIKALVSDLNLASKLEYDMQPLQSVSIYPAALVRSVAAYFLNSGLNSGYSIEVNVKNDAQSIRILGDEELLKRAVSNLITNSIEHNPNGCAIMVTVDKKSSYCEITVSDNGTGFPQEILAAVKSPISTSELHNHGLGLTIVRQILKAHNGTAKFNNLPEGGCTAVLRLPFIIENI